MNTPAPKTAAVKLWNQLVSLTRDDNVALDRILTQLWPLAAKQQGNFDLQLASAYAQLLRGNRQAAAPHLDAAYNLRFAEHLIDTTNLIGTLLDYGLTEKARLLCKEWLSRPEAAHLIGLGQVSTNVAVRLGDLALLRQITETYNATDVIAKDVLDLLEAARLLDYFPAHQQETERILGPITCVFRAEVLDMDASPTLVLSYYTPLSLDEAFDLDDRLFETLSGVYADYPDGDCPYMGVITTMISGPFIPPVEETQ